jgi:heme-degrading monooxygenase HmoA
VFARVHTLEATPEQQDEGLELVRDVYLPWARDSSGFRGLVRLSDRAGGTVLVITFWASEEALRGSAEAAERLADRVAETSGATRSAVGTYEVSLLEL